MYIFQHISLSLYTCTRIYVYTRCICSGLFKGIQVKGRYSFPVATSRVSESVEIDRVLQGKSAKARSKRLACEEKSEVPD